MHTQRALLIGLLAALVWPLAAAADDFRIETKVFDGKEKKAASHNVTLFQAGCVYDYLTDPDRVAVFDRARGRFILLDPARKMKVEVKTDDVLIFSEKFHSWAAKSGSAYMKFAADPQFEVKLGEDGVLTLETPHLTYRVETVPAASDATSQQYREFSDWYARFNAMLNLGSPPPFPRLAVNKELAQRKLIPTEVSLTIPTQAGSGVRAVSMRSEHHVTARLLPRDLEKIAETANQLAAFKAVDLAEFEPDLVGKR